MSTVNEPGSVPIDHVHVACYSGGVDDDGVENVLSVDFVKRVAGDNKMCSSTLSQENLRKFSRKAWIAISVPIGTPFAI